MNEWMAGWLNDSEWKWQSMHLKQFVLPHTWLLLFSRFVHFISFQFYFSYFYFFHFHFHFSYFYSFSFSMFSVVVNAQKCFTSCLAAILLHCSYAACQGATARSALLQCDEQREGRGEERWWLEWWGCHHVRKSRTWSRSPTGMLKRLHNMTQHWHWYG